MLKKVPISLSGPVMNIKLVLKLIFSNQHWVAMGQPQQTIDALSYLITFIN